MVWSNYTKGYKIGSLLGPDDATTKIDFMYADRANKIEMYLIK